MNDGNLDLSWFSGPGQIQIVGATQDDLIEWQLT